jgi:transketolase
MTLDELKGLRQINSKTASHPEYKQADGIGTTSGPLDQGLANAVGFACAERILNAGLAMSCASIGPSSSWTTAA